MIKEATLSLPHPIVFIYDPECESVEVPKNYAEDFVSYTNSCISLWAQANVDGPVTVRLVDEFPDASTQGKWVFKGLVEMPSKRVAILTSEVEPILSLDIRSTKTDLDIWTNGDTFPDEILVVADAPPRP